MRTGASDQGPGAGNPPPTTHHPPPAFKIYEIWRVWGAEADGSRMLVLENVEGVRPMGHHFLATRDMIEKYTPIPGDFLVRRDDGSAQILRKELIGCPACIINRGKHSPTCAYFAPAHDRKGSGVGGRGSVSAKP